MSVVPNNAELMERLSQFSKKITSLETNLSNFKSEEIILQFPDHMSKHHLGVTLEILTDLLFATIIKSQVI